MINFKWLIVVGLFTLALISIIPSKDMKYGACIHSGHYNDLNGMKELGLDIVRDDLIWSGIEKTKGVYDFAWADQRVNNLTRLGIEMNWLLLYSNNLYNFCKENNGSRCDVYVPQDPNQFEIFKEAYGNYISATVNHFKGKVKYYECWNEPNGFWDPINYTIQTKQYSELLKECYTRVKQVDKEAIVVVAGTGSTDSHVGDFWRPLFENGIADYYDIIAVHPYCDYSENYPSVSQMGYTCEPLENMDLIKSLAKHYGGNTEMWITEFGYPTEGTGWSRQNSLPSKPYSTKTEEERESYQAIRLNNLFKALKSYPEVTAVFWYDYMDDCGESDGVNNIRRFTNTNCPNKYSIDNLDICPIDHECRFGLVKKDLTKKISWYAYKNIING